MQVPRNYLSTKLFSIAQTLALISTISASSAKAQTADLKNLPAVPSKPGSFRVEFPTLVDPGTQSKIRQFGEELIGLAERDQELKAVRKQVAEAKARQEKKYQELLAEVHQAKEKLITAGVEGRKGIENKVDRYQERLASIKIELAAEAGRLEEISSQQAQLKKRRQEISIEVREMTEKARTFAPEELKRYIAAYENAPVLENTLILGFVPDASDEQIAAVLNLYNLHPVARAPGSNVLLVKTKIDIQPSFERAVAFAKLIATLKSHPLVRGVSFNVPLAGMSSQTPSAPVPTCEQALNVDWNWEQESTLPCAQTFIRMRFPAAWTLLKRVRPNAKIRIGILDEGFYELDDLKPLQMGVGCKSEKDDHGTAVLSILGARWNKKGFDGALPNADIILCAPPALKFESGKPEASDRGYDLFTSIVYLDWLIEKNSVSVVNFSLGYNWYSLKERDENAFRLQIQNHLDNLLLWSDTLQKVIISTAAGNDSLKWSNFPSSLASPLNALYASDTAKYSNILVVGALANDGTLYKGSNAGPSVLAYGVQIPVYQETAPKLLDGTSLATPFVTAVAAMVKAMNQDLAPGAVADTIRRARGAHGAVDALEALLWSLPETQALRLLADLDGDGVVGPGDAEKLSRAIAESRGLGAVEDLNGDGVVSLDRGKTALVRGKFLSDVEVLESAWTANAPLPNWQP